jgi:hypothetical protein
MNPLARFAAMVYVEESAAKFRSQIISQNDKALRTLSEAYRDSWRRVSGQLDQVTKQIQAAQAIGKSSTLRVPGSKVALKPNEFSINWLARQARYKALLTQMESELGKLAKLGAATTTDQQQAALDLTLSHSRDLLKSAVGTPPPGLGISLNHAPTEALTNLVGVLQDGSPVAALFDQFPAAVIQGVKDTFKTSLIEGWGPRKLAAQIKRAYGEGLTHTLLTCRTETMRAYNTGAHETYKANSRVCNGWIWLCARSKRTCSACWGMDGSFHTLDERLTDHPGGRCVQICSTRPWKEIYPNQDVSGVKETSTQPWEPEKFFSKLSVSDQRHVLGRSRYEAWKAGSLRLRDIPRTNSSKIWGDSVRPGTLKELGVARAPRKQSTK